MNFLELNYTMLDEAVKLRQELKKGKVSFENYIAHMGGMAQVGKMMDRHMRMMAFEIRFKKPLSNVGKNMIGYDPEADEIKCPDQEDKKITRGSCLDFSGAASNLEKCQTCQQFKITRKLLIGDN